MSTALARALVLTEVLPWSSVAQALFLSTTKNVPFLHAVLELNLLPRERLEEELARADAPVAKTLVPDVTWLAKLPPGLCARLLALPVGKATGPGGKKQAVVALADPRDEHALGELTFHLGAEVVAVRASLSDMSAAVSALPKPKAEESFMESTLVSMRAPEGIVLPPSERGAARPPAPPSAVPLSASGADASAIPLVRRSQEPSMPIPLVRRMSDGEPVLELRSPYSRVPRSVESPAAIAMRTATDRNEILRLLLEGAMEHARRVILFAVRRDGFGGLLCTPTMGDEAAIRDLRVPLDEPSMLATVATGGTYFGPIYSAPAHVPLLALLPAVSDSVAVTAARLRGRPLVLMLAEGMEKPELAMRHLDELTRAAGEAFARILATKGE
ncbi:MAG: hypothetical protein IPG50_38470 [Myxococcales bacterium]|nr:hypothetical protein [Myxococcales bacterium]